MCLYFTFDKEKYCYQSVINIVFKLTKAQNSAE